MRFAIVKALVLVVALASVGAACSKKKEEDAAGGTITVAGEKANNHGTKTVSGSTFELEADNEGSDFYFDPTVLKGSPGAKVTLTVKNEGSTLHNFTIEDQNVDEDVKPDEEVTVTVTFPQSGVVEFHCEYHQARGMVGELTV